MSRVIPASRMIESICRVGRVPESHVHEVYEFNTGAGDGAASIQLSIPKCVERCGRLHDMYYGTVLIVVHERDFRASWRDEYHR